MSPCFSRRTYQSRRTAILRLIWMLMRRKTTSSRSPRPSRRNKHIFHTRREGATPCQIPRTRKHFLSLRSPALHLACHSQPLIQIAHCLVERKAQWLRMRSVHAPNKHRAQQSVSWSWLTLKRMPRSTPVSHHHFFATEAVLLRHQMVQAYPRRKSRLRSLREFSLEFVEGLFPAHP